MNIFKLVAGIVVSLPVAIAVAQQPRSFVQTPIGFSAVNQSLWQPGAPGPALSYSFDTGGAFAIFATGQLFGGNVNATYNGAVNTLYPSVTRPGLTTLTMGFEHGARNAATFNSNLGAAFTGGVRIPVFSGPTYSASLGFNPSATSVVPLGASLSATAAPSTTFQIPFTSVTLGARQNTVFTPQAISGVLGYTLRGTGIGFVRPVMFGTQSFADVTVNLPRPGTWDFAYRDLSLDNLLSTDFDLQVSGRVDLPWPLPDAAVGPWNYNVFDVAPFELDFGEVTVARAFSITAVPEPSTYLMFLAGLGALVGWRARARPR